MLLPSRSGLALGCALGVLVLSPAVAGPAIVIDVDSGRVLHQEEATAPWFPASVTKLMTAYVALRQVSAGRLSLETPLLVSQRAARMAPSKIGFKPGQIVTLDNALKIIMVKSANDVSVTIAEGIGGSVEGFADMMNREAQRLGMRDSHFVNPNGLPDAQQRTSARDMALLGRALLLEFPRHRELWGIGAIQLGKRVMPNTNGLIGRYPGATGMKTGFICSSGFNVVAAAERGGQRLITVVMGSPSAAERTIRASELFDRGFSGGGWGGQLAQDLPSVGGEPPDKRPEICGRNRAIPSEEGIEFAAPVAASANGNNPEREMFAPPAAAAAQVQGTTRRTLGPRAQFEPVIVYAGRAPGSTLAVRGPGAAPPAAPASALAAAPAPAPAATTTPTRAGAIAAPAGTQALAPTQASLPGIPAAAPGQPMQLQGVVPLPPARLARPTPTQAPAAARPSAGASLVTGGRAAPAASPGAIAPRAPQAPTAQAASTTARQAASPAAKPAAKPAVKPVAQPRPPEKPRAAQPSRAGASPAAATAPRAATPAPPRPPAPPVVEKPKYD